jgi:hypothetical protein
MFNIQHKANWERIQQRKKSNSKSQKQNRKFRYRDNVLKVEDKVLKQRHRK